MLLNFQHSEVLKLLSLSQATHSLLSPCNSRKSCFTARFTLSSHCHLFVPPPHLLCWAKQTQNFTNTSSFPWASALPFRPQLLFPNAPPAHTHVLTGSWYYLPLPVARSLVHCISWNCSCTKKAWGQCLPAPKPQAPQLHSSNQQTAQGQAAFSTKAVRRKQQRFLPLSGGYRAMWKSRVKAIMCYSPTTVNDPSNVSASKSTRLRKTRGGEEWERQGWRSQIHPAFPGSTLFSCPACSGESREDKVPGVRARAARGSNLPGYQTGQGKQKTRENLGNLLSGLAHFLGMFYLFVCFPETSVLRIQDFP